MPTDKTLEVKGRRYTWSDAPTEVWDEKVELSLATAVHMIPVLDALRTDRQRIAALRHALSAIAKPRNVVDPDFRRAADLAMDRRDWAQAALAVDDDALAEEAPNGK